jgi:hypothetical protein
MELGFGWRLSKIGGKDKPRACGINPPWLKPDFFGGFSGTSELVPFQTSYEFDFFQQ